MNYSVNFKWALEGKKRVLNFIYYVLEYIFLPFVDYSNFGLTGDSYYEAHELIMVDIRNLVFMVILVLIVILCLFAVV